MLSHLLQPLDQQLPRHIRVSLTISDAVIFPIETEDKFDIQAHQCFVRAKN